MQSGPFPIDVPLWMTRAWSNATGPLVSSDDEDDDDDDGRKVYDGNIFKAVQTAAQPQHFENGPVDELVEGSEIVVNVLVAQTAAL